MNDSTALSTGFLTRPAAYTQPEIFQRMLAALATALPDLKTREEDDPTIALLDVCSLTLDVLSFYQQQFNNECYLETATQLVSARELARTINYELNPGMAANVYLAFQIDANANNTGAALIPAGTQVQSTPQQSKSPQAFETRVALTAYAAWNQITPYQPQITLTQTINAATISLWLSGISTGLASGDVLLLMGNYNQTTTQAAYQLTVQTVIIDTLNNRTQITWQADWAIDPSTQASKDLSGHTIVLSPTDTLTDPQLSVFNQQVGSFGNNAPLVSSFPSSSYYMQTGRNDWDAKAQISNDPTKPGIIPTVWRDSQAVYFGTGNTFIPKIYANQAVADSAVGSFVLLSVDNPDPQKPYPYQKLYSIKAAEDVSRADFGLSGQVTQLTLNDMQGGPATDDIYFLFRTTAIYLQTKPLALYTAVSDDQTFVLSATNGIPLAGDISPALQLGQSVIISNLTKTLSETISWTDVQSSSVGSNNCKYVFTLKNAPTFSYQLDTTTISGSTLTTPVNMTLDLSDPSNPKFFVIAPINPIPPESKGMPLTLSGKLLQQSEMFTIGTISFIDNTPQAQNDSNTSLIPGYITIYPKDALVNNYYPATSIIYGNVVAATHGATVTQVVGSGDATQANQQFNLQKLPLTYLPSTLTNTAIPGIASTLNIAVNTVTWDETPSLYALTPNSKNYVLTQEDSGQVTITFGDGAKGARLPTGQENIQATYRQGIGTIGNVASNSLILLQTRPQGVISVTNPAAATGGVDAESLSAAYQNAPSGVLTLNRLVSQTDFENYASTQTNIGKSRADFLSQAGGQPVLFITLSGPDGVAISPNDISTLLCAINKVSNLGQNITAATYEPLQFNMEATLTIANGYQSELVIDQATQTLLNRYGFAQQQFAQDVIAGDIIETLRKVAGVLAVELDAFYYTTDTSTPHPRKDILYAEPARLNSDDTVILPAQLLTINPAPNIGITLTAISAVTNTC